MEQQLQQESPSKTAMGLINLVNHPSVDQVFIDDLLKYYQQGPVIPTITQGLVKYENCAVLGATLDPNEPRQIIYTFAYEHIAVFTPAPVAFINKISQAMRAEYGDYEDSDIRVLSLNKKITEIFRSAMTTSGLAGFFSDYALQTMANEGLLPLIHAISPRVALRFAQDPTPSLSAEECQAVMAEIQKMLVNLEITIQSSPTPGTNSRNVTLAGSDRVQTALLSIVMNTPRELPIFYE